MSFLSAVTDMEIGSVSDGAKAVSDSHPNSFKEFDKENAERSGSEKENTKGKMRPWTIDDFEIGSYNLKNTLIFPFIFQQTSISDMIPN
jgi:hypothetical protein